MKCMPHGYRRVEGWRAGYRKTNTATAIQTIAKTATIPFRTIRNSIKIIKISIKMNAGTINKTPMRIFKIPKIIIRMGAKTITTTTIALAKLSRSQPSLTVRSGMP